MFLIAHLTLDDRLDAVPESSDEVGKDPLAMTLLIWKWTCLLLISPRDLFGAVCGF